jgi:hypothetical protein
MAPARPGNASDSLGMVGDLRKNMKASGSFLLG